ncbi:hypothetical protein [Aeromicrobium sp. 9AM]|uniref:hypothetical protein n=1 Tax=Aeromicrobium sp. 9AM TaxID=2653126 RepID=UPI0012F2411B|nr:hypothetical protein [Aeromicrobium sp. 9AM]VXA94773.1 conserved hypothetical protein [Aeromicrobium sp. 9AM]
MSNGLIFLLIPVAALAVVVLGGMLVLKLQKVAWRVDVRPIETNPTRPTGFQQAAGETREAFVRRHWQRPGVVADGVTLVDLYDRINELERRLAEAERQNHPS